MREKRFVYNYIAAILMCMATAIISLTGCKQDEVENNNIVELYYLNPCDACKEDVLFENAIRQALKDRGVENSLEFQIYNIFRVNEQGQMEKRTHELGIEDKMWKVPAAYMAGKWYLGSHEEIGAQLAADLAGEVTLAGGKQVEDVSHGNKDENEVGEVELEEWLHILEMKKDEANIIYFYREDCQECIDVEPFMEELPETIQIEGNEITLNLIKLNSREGNNGELIRALFKVYEVPSQDQKVPFVFLSDTYLAGQEEIEKKLLSLLQGELD